MENYTLTTPVVFIVFNRLDCAQEVFEQIRKAQPQKLYIVSDGPRETHEGELQKVKSVRTYIESNVDWECNVQYNYAEKNMGSKYRIYSGLNWVFSQEEQAIILEDDCVPSQDFFRYCQELLQMYKEDKKVWMISGINVVRKQSSKEPYFFSKFAGIWGWATWKRAWEQIDIELKTWPQVKKNGGIKYAYDFFSYRSMLRVIKHQVEGKRDAWDIPWRYSIITNHGVGIMPRENLVSNIGCGRADASNTTEEVTIDFSYGKPMEFPLKKQEKIEADMQYEKEHLKNGAGIKKELHYIKYLFTRIIPKTKELIDKTLKR